MYIMQYDHYRVLKKSINRLLHDIFLIRPEITSFGNIVFFIYKQ